MDTTEALPVRYEITIEKIRDWGKEYAALACDTREGYEETRQAIAVLRTTLTAAIEEIEEAAERAEQERQQAAEEARIRELERQARIEALRPDAEKLAAFADAIETLAPPDVRDPAAAKALGDALSALGAVAAKLRAALREP